MTHTATDHTITRDVATGHPAPASPGSRQVRRRRDPGRRQVRRRRDPGRRRVPAVLALAMAAGVALAGCSGGGESEPATSPTTQATTSSSSTTPTSTTAAAETAAPISAPTSTATPVVPAPPPAPLPANVVGTGGPCQMIGDLAQADDGSPLFCTEDPGGAGPLWLPQPGAGPEGTGPGLLGRPCMQEGVGVTTPDGELFTCRLTGGGDVPGGLYWQR